MALTQAERSARHKEKLRKQGRVLLHLWIDAELDTMIKKLLATQSTLSNLSKEKALQTVLFNAVNCVASNVTSNETSVTSNIATNDLLLKETKQLKLTVESLQTRLNELEKSVASNVSSNKLDVPSNVATNEIKAPSNLIFDIEKAKAIAIELKAQGKTGNQIALELAQQGYGNKYGKPFSKSSINKWFQKVR